ncbi:MAG: 30S ribosomal protein S6 [Candidatus Paceibacterota bacterium]|jgi:ribosomal protein S6
MNDHDDRLTVYEIGYLVSNTVAPEHVATEADKIRQIIEDAGGKVIADGSPSLNKLAYTIRQKTTGGAYAKFDEAYFGWIKFEIGSSKIEAIKKTVEIMPTILRMLLTVTIRENTFLGKRIPAPILNIPVGGVSLDGKIEVGAVTTPISVEDMDKSIDDMVKEV